MGRDDQPQGNKLQLLETEVTKMGRVTSSSSKPGHSAHTEDRLQVLEEEVVKMSQLGSINKLDQSPPPASSCTSSQPGAFACIVHQQQTGDDAQGGSSGAVIEGERLNCKTVTASRTMEAGLMQKQEAALSPLATTTNAAPPSNGMSNLEDAVLRKQETRASSANATTISSNSVESDLLKKQGAYFAPSRDDDVSNNRDRNVDDLERGITTTTPSSSLITSTVRSNRCNNTRNQLDAFEASIEAKASTVPALSSTTNTNQYEDIAVEPIEQEQPADDNASKSSIGGYMSDTYDETYGESTSIEAEIAPDFEGLEREHNMLVEKIREMSTKEVVEAEVLPSKRRLWCITTVSVLILVTVVVTLAVTLTKENATLVAAENAGYAKCSKSPPEVDFNTSTDRYITLRAIFDPVYGAETFADENENNHRFRALHWLANEDTLQLSLESGANLILQTIQQRYVLVLFYFSMHGWCWTNNLNWLSGFHECRWEHISLCFAGSVVQKIGIPTNNLIGTLPPELGLLSSHLDRFDLGTSL